MVERKVLLDYINLFSSNDYQKNGKIIYNNFKHKHVKRKLSLDFRLKTIDKARNYLFEEIK